MSRELTPDHILQEALAVQRQATKDFVNGKAPPLVLTVLGCGTMGIAILGGIMDSLSATKASPATETDHETPDRLPSVFNACVRSAKSANRIKEELGKYDVKLNIRENDNLAAVQEADVVLLGCKPYMVSAVLGTDEMRDALKGKLLVSILAGVTEAAISRTLYQDSVPDDACRIVRAMPNTAAAVRESMTVIGTSDALLPAETQKLLTWMFNQIGRVAYLPSANMDVCTALCGSGPAFVSVIIESMAAGAVAMGMPRDEAYTMAAQTMRGATGLVLGGEHPAILRDKVTTPGGCTIGGLLVLEEGGVRGVMARAVREATVVASQLGQGKQGVNGTRH